MTSHLNGLKYRKHGGKKVNLMMKNHFFISSWVHTWGKTSFLYLELTWSLHNHLHLQDIGRSYVERTLKWNWLIFRRAYGCQGSVGEPWKCGQTAGCNLKWCIFVFLSIFILIFLCKHLFFKYKSNLKLETQHVLLDKRAWHTHTYVK